MYIKVQYTEDWGTNWHSSSTVKGCFQSNLSKLTPQLYQMAFTLKVITMLCVVCLLENKIQTDMLTCHKIGSCYAEVLQERREGKREGKKLLEPSWGMAQASDNIGRGCVNADESDCGIRQETFNPQHLIALLCQPTGRGCVCVCVCVCVWVVWGGGCLRAATGAAAMAAITAAASVRRCSPPSRLCLFLV